MTITKDHLTSEYVFKAKDDKEKDIIIYLVILYRYGSYEVKNNNRQTSFNFSNIKDSGRMRIICDLIDEAENFAKAELNKKKS
jgi:hypothetical protein